MASASNSGKPQTAYWAFISYSRQDERWARWLHRALEGYRLPRKLRRRYPGLAGSGRLGAVFRDRDELPSGSQLGSEIEKGLQRSRNLIVICSPQAAVSKWVNQEVQYFRQLGRSDHIYCLLVDGDPQQSFCPALRHDSDALDSIAADVRPQGDSRHDALLRLVAGTLGLGFDDLKQREWHARQRRLGLIAAAALLLSTVMSYLAWSALQARDAAVLAEQRAVQRLKQSEAMEDVFNQMFREAGEQQGGNATARDLLSASAARIARRFDEQPEVAARVLQQIGSLYLYLDDYAPALDLLEQVLEMPSAAFDVRAMAAFDLSQVYVINGDNEKSAQRLELARNLWQSQAEQYRDELLQTVLIESRLLRAAGDVQAAVAVLKDALPQRLALSGEHARQSAVLMANLGVAYLYLGEQEEARQMMRRAWTAFEADGAGGSSNALAVRNNLASLELTAGHFSAAETLFREALLTRRELQPPSANTAALINNFAKLKRQSGAYAEAQALIDEARPMTDQFAGSSSPLSWAVWVNQGELLLALDKYSEARVVFAQACPMAAKLMGEEHARTLWCRVLQQRASPDYPVVSAAMADLIAQLKRQGIAARPFLDPALWELSLLHLRQQEYAAALASLQAQRELHAADPKIPAYQRWRNLALLQALSPDEVPDSDLAAARRGLEDDHPVIAQIDRLISTLAGWPQD